MPRKNDGPFSPFTVEGQPLTGKRRLSKKDLELLAEVSAEEDSEGDTAQATVAKPEKAEKVGKKPKLGKATNISIPQIELAQFMITLVGSTSLIVNRWSEKAKGMMLSKQLKEPRQAKEAKNPWADFIASLYVIDPVTLNHTKYCPDEEKEKGKTGINESKIIFGFPALAVKRAAVSACSYIDGVTKVAARGTFHVLGYKGTDLLKVNGLVNMREDMVRVGMGVADIRYRGEFREWSIDVPIRYNKRAISPEQIVNLLNNAGFGVGLGEHRPECDGMNGCFEVQTSKQD